MEDFEEVVGERAGTEELMGYLEEAMTLVGRLENARNQKQKVSAEVVRLEKQRDAITKAINDEITITTKKRRDELLDGYQQQVNEAEAMLKKVVEKKEAARSAGKKERTERETAGLRRRTAELENEQKAAMSDAKLSDICARPWFLHIFMPGSWLDYVMLLLVGVILIYVVPYGLFGLMMDDKLKLTMIFGCFWIVITQIYMIVHMKICLPKKDALEEVAAMSRTIKANKREIKNIQAAIAADESEEYYHLDDYNYEIAKAEAIRDEMIGKRDAAMKNFDMVTKKVIADEIRMGYDEQLTENDLSYSKKSSDLERVDKQVTALYTKAMERYGGRLGKDNLKTEDIEGIRKILVEKNLSSITEAVNIYNGHVF